MFNSMSFISYYHEQQIPKDLFGLLFFFIWGEYLLKGCDVKMSLSFFTDWEDEVLYLKRLKQILFRIVFDLLLQLQCCGIMQS